MRCDSTVVETGILWPSDAGLSLEAVRALAREGRRVAALAGKGAKRVQDRSRAVAERLRLIGRTLARRRGEKRAEVLRLTGEAGELLRRSIREARALAGGLASRGVGPPRPTSRLRAGSTNLADCAGKVAPSDRPAPGRRVDQRSPGSSPMPTPAPSGQAAAFDESVRNSSGGYDYVLTAPSEGL
jgi:hypothetical protein